jgi:ribose/xylose/arabinose/galactoside ABC-type transport system permease subunit
MNVNTLMNNCLVVIKKNRIPVLTVLVFVVVSILRPPFLSPINIFSLFDYLSGYGITAVGLTFVLLCGQLDISFGSTMALTSCIFLLIAPHGGFVPATLGALAMGCLLGAFTGFFVAFFRLSPFMVSMTMQIAYRGIALTITNNKPIQYMDPVIGAMSRISFFNIPLVFFIFLLVVFMAHFVLRRTRFGRNLYIIGGNIKVADSIGINVRNHVWTAFIIQGFMAALGGIVLMTRTFSASGNTAMDSLGSIIPMVIVGGTAFSGGKGGAIKTLFGVMLMGFIYNAMVMFNLHINFQQLIRGLILLTIIVSDKYMENRQKKI